MEAPRRLDALRTAAEERNAAAVTSAAHAIKGSVGLFSTGAAYEAARTLEAAARDGNLTDVESRSAHLASEVSKVMADLEKLLKIQDAKPDGGYNQRRCPQTSTSPHKSLARSRSGGGCGVGLHAFRGQRRPFRFAVSFPAARSAQPLDGRILLFISDDGRTEPRTQTDQYRANSTRPISASTSTG